ncbi:PREDICTED: cinnamoyl-CoA reductase-like SNL6 [Camelina sativa]|uniref:Cinnamoyl-CoA reductase-like SNL6 n=1 Tax=Camelina sativa TaxID=90675 RepID=A0ABM0TFA8_CAMSA|nr:PREDICTED: cinnamoyl-CoA reductase-like SNL6 [Camelina sativa]
MRIVPKTDNYETELAELTLSVNVSTATKRRKQEDEKWFKRSEKSIYDYNLDEDNPKVVCITDGVTFVGRAIVERLLLHGYTVRVIVNTPDELERVRVMKDEMAKFYGRIEAVSAKLTEIESLVDAFDGCYGVFHTSGFIDPSGVSGYSKYMAEIEAKVSENVMNACSMTQSVRRCLMTSSLLACLWQNNTQLDRRSVIDHSSWSDESLCKDKKLWYALGKLKAEKIAWKIAENKGFKLVTICAALVTSPNILQHNSTPTIAYLKGGEEMYRNGVLATVDVNTLAKVHVRVYEEMRQRLIYKGFEGTSIIIATWTVRTRFAYQTEDFLP